MRHKAGLLFPIIAPQFRPPLAGLSSAVGAMVLFWAATTMAEAAADGDKQVHPMDLSFEQLLEVKVDNVYGASRRTQKVSEAPSAVSIVTHEEIRRYGHRTLKDVLNSVRGLYVTSDRNYSYLGVRGFNRPGDYNSRILMLVDGHRMNDPIYDSLLLGTDFILDVDLIDRVEVIRGPSSSIYGNNAFLAVINVITRRGRDLNGVEASVDGGSLDTYRGRFSLGRQFKNEVELLLSGTYYESGGNDRLFYPEYAAPATNNGNADNADEARFYNSLLTLSYKEFTLQGAYVHREKHIPTGSFATLFNDPRARTIDEQGYLDLSWQREWTPDWSTKARVYADRYDYYGDYPYPGLLNKDFAHGQWIGTELQVNRTLFDRHILTMGADYRNALQQAQGNYDVDPSAVYVDDRRSSHNWALFTQLELQIRTNLLLNAGVRHDRYDVYGDSTNPRLALIYEPLAGTTFKALYGTAFRAPNVFEAYYTGVGAKADPTLGPESIATHELVFEQRLPWNLRFSASAYHYDIDDLISQVLDPADGKVVYRNIDKVRARGLEFELERRLSGGTHARLSYVFQETEDPRTGMPLSNSPRHLGKLNVSVPLHKEKVFAGLELQYASAGQTLGGTGSGDFLVANFTVYGRELLPGLEVSASIYNLFDRQYGFPGGAEHLQRVIPQDGRGFRVKLTYRF